MARSAKALRTIARGRALSDLAARHRQEYAQLYNAWVTRVFRDEGINPNGQRRAKHVADETGRCVIDGEVMPCKQARRRSSNGAK